MIFGIKQLRNIDADFAKVRCPACRKENIFAINTESENDVRLARILELLSERLQQNITRVRALLSGHLYVDPEDMLLISDLRDVRKVRDLVDMQSTN